MRSEKKRPRGVSIREKTQATAQLTFRAEWECFHQVT